MTAARQRFLATNAPGPALFVRVIVGWIFFSEGIQKFLFPDALGVGRFAKIGIPAPEVLTVRLRRCGPELSRSVASPRRPSARGGCSRPQDRGQARHHPLAPEDASAAPPARASR